MRFKDYLLIFEALSPEVQAILEKSKFPVTQDLVAQAIKDLNSDLDKEGKVITDKATAFKLIRQKLGLEKKPEVPEPAEAILKPFYKKLTEKQITLPEYKTAEYFKNSQPASLNLVMQELNQIIADGKAELLFADEPQLVFRGENFSNFKDLADFATKIHAIQAATNKPSEGFSEFRDPIAADLKHHGTMIWPLKSMKDNPSKIYIFKGDSFLKCKYFGKGAPWCVTKSPLHYYDYKTGKGQTQFFIIDYNKAPNDPARYTNPGISENPINSEFVDLDNEPHSRDSRQTSFGINGFEGSAEYMDYLKEMGVPNPWELMKPDQVSQHEKEFSFKMSHPGNLEWARSKGPNVVKEYLEALGAQELHLTEKDFNSLSNDEKYTYMVDTGLKPENHSEANYLSSLSRKDYKEYLSNYEIDDFREDDKKYLKDLLLNIKSEKQPTDELLQYYAQKILLTTSLDLDLIGAGNTKNYPMLYLQSAKNSDGFYRQDYPVQAAHKQILLPLVSGQTTPIKAYNYIMSNLKELEKTDDDYLVNLIANDDLKSDQDHNRYESDKQRQAAIYQNKKNYGNLKRMIFKNLDDEAKKRVLTTAELYDEENNGESPPVGRYSQLLNDQQQNLVKSLIRNIDDLKKIYNLIGKQPWMAEITNVFKNLSKEDHDWVIKHIGKTPFTKNTLDFTQELARKHFKYADKIEDYMIIRYIAAAGLENTLQFLANNNYFDKVEDHTILNLLMNFLGRNNNEQVMKTFLKYVPTDRLYSPKMILDYLLTYRANEFIDANGKPNEYALKDLTDYISHAKPSHLKALRDAIGNDDKIQYKIAHNTGGFARLMRLQKYLPDLVDALFSNLTPEMYKSFIQNADMDYLSQIVTPQWFSEVGEDAISALLNRVTYKIARSYYDVDAEKSLQAKIIDDAKPFSKKIIKDLAALLNNHQIISEKAAEAVKPYLEKLPLDALKDYLVYTSDSRNGKIDLRNTILSRILTDKIKQISFDMFLDIFKSLSNSLDRKKLSEIYLKTHDPLSDEQAQALFNAGIRKEYLDTVWSLESLAQHQPDQLIKMTDKYGEDNPEAKDGIVKRLKELANHAKEKKEKEKNK